MSGAIRIYKFSGIKPSIYVELGGMNSVLDVALYLDSCEVETIRTKTGSHLFRISTEGEYYVIARQGNLEFESNKIYFYNRELQPTELDRTVGNVSDFNLKGRDYVIDNGKGFYIEIKIKKGFSLALREKISKWVLSDNLQKKVLDTTSFSIEHSIHNYEYYEIHQGLDKSKAVEFCAQIESLDYVIYCSATPVAENLSPPFIDGVDKSKSIYLEYSETPDFSELQGYVNDVNGMNIRRHWEKGHTGELATVRLLDFGIYKDHEDFQQGNIIVVNSRDESSDCNHGTASTGCIAAGNNGFGVTGIAHSALFYFYDTGDRHKILEHANPGDIVSLNIQWNSDHGYIPAVAIKSWWDTISNLTEKGAVVIMAAGNGNNDLSDTAICPDYGDCGGILAGGCLSATGRRRPKSNYGHYASLINSWGHNVVATGYGALQDQPGHNRDYTNTYNGTSSATPLCAGALALLQSYAMKQEFVLSPEEMKRLISRSAYTEGVVDNIGRRPNVEQLVTLIDHMALSPVAGVNPFPVSDNYLNCNVFLRYGQNNSASVHFDYRHSEIENTGVVSYFAIEGPSALEWLGEGSTLIKVPVLDEDHNVQVLYLKASKSMLAGSFTMNSAADTQDHSAGEFDLVFTFESAENKYLPGGVYHGVLPLYVKSWKHKDYALPVIINIFIGAL